MKNKFSILLWTIALLVSTPALGWFDVDKPLPTKENKGGGNSGGRTMANCANSASRAVLDINNVRCMLHNGGDMWWDLLSVPQYEVPKVTEAGQPSRHSMFAGGIWVGGVDTTAKQTVVVAQTYRQGGQVSYWPGPLECDGPQKGRTEDLTCSAFDRHFTVKRDVVNEFVTTWYPGIGEDEIPDEILTWPGRGNPYLPKRVESFAGVNIDRCLAPFVDVNCDGKYDPLQGDHPLMPGAEFGSGADQVIWWVTNDQGGANGDASLKNFGAGFGDPDRGVIGMEFHYEAFGYATNNAVNNMTFYRQRLINRGNRIIDTTYFGQWSDPDLGYAYDDYVGCDVARGLGICYNGDDFDETQFGYGENPPAIAVDFFIGPVADRFNGLDDNKNGTVDEPFERIIMSNFTYYNNTSDQRTGNPSRGIHYYFYLQNRWKDGSYATYDLKNGASPTDPNGNPARRANFVFPGATDLKGWSFYPSVSTETTVSVNINGVDTTYIQRRPVPPTSVTNWDERVAGNPPGDRRFLLSAGPFRLEPGAVNFLTVGVVWGRASSGGAFGSVASVLRADDFAQDLFDRDFQILNGPNSPNVAVTELDQEIILTLIPDTFTLAATNTGITGNRCFWAVNNNLLNDNTREDVLKVDGCNCTRLNETSGITGGLMTTLSYTEKDRALVKKCGDENANYRFEGYIVYQLRSSEVTTAELDDPNKARIVAQYDIANGITNIVENVPSNDIPGTTVPKIMVQGKDNGITNVIQVKRDLFATDREALINFKRYHFLVVAYATTPCDSAEIKFLVGRGNSENARVTAIPHKPNPEQNGTVLASTFGQEIPITRISGQGTGNVGTRSVQIESASEEAILNSSTHAATELKYQLGSSPIEVKVYDPKRVRAGNFKLTMHSILGADRSLAALQEGDTVISLRSQTRLRPGSTGAGEFFSDIPGQTNTYKYRGRAELINGIAVVTRKIEGSPNRVIVDMLNDEEGGSFLVKIDSFIGRPITTVGKREVNEDLLYSANTTVSVQDTVEETEEKGDTVLALTSDSIAKVVNYLQAQNWLTSNFFGTIVPNPIQTRQLSNGSWYIFAIKRTWTIQTVSQNITVRNNFFGYRTRPAKFIAKRGGTVLDTFTCNTFEGFNAWDLEETNTGRKWLNNSINDELLLPDFGVTVKVNGNVLYAPGVNVYETDRNGFLSVSATFTDNTKQWLRPALDLWRNSADINRQRALDRGIYNSGSNIWMPYGLVGKAAYPFAVWNDTLAQFSNANANLTAIRNAADSALSFQLNAQRRLSVQKARNIDVVITDDKSKWTRVVVLQEDTSGQTFIQDQYRLTKSRVKSVNKEFSADNSTSPFQNQVSRGMSWFPGYAIDVERGIRLNMMFAEKQTEGVVGNNLIWDPTTTTVSNFIYVMETKYDEGRRYEFLFDSITAAPINGNPPYVPGVNITGNNRNLLARDRRQAQFGRKIFSEVSWVGAMRLAPEFDNQVDVANAVIPTTVRFSLRVKRPFNSFSPSGNEAIAPPVYTFTTGGLEPRFNDRATAESALDLIRVVPNPYYGYSLYETSQTDNRVKITNLPIRCSVAIYTLNGTLVRKLAKDDRSTFIDWDMKNHKGIPVASGAYIIHIDAGEIGQKTVKWMGVLRPIDLDGLPTSGGR